MCLSNNLTQLEAWEKACDKRLAWNQGTCCYENNVPLNTRIILNSGTQKHTHTPHEASRDLGNWGNKDFLSHTDPLTMGLTLNEQNVRCQFKRMCVCVCQVKFIYIRCNTNMLKCKKVLWFICKHQIIIFILFGFSPYASSFQYFRTLLCLLTDANPEGLRIVVLEHLETKVLFPEYGMIFLQSCK